MDVIRDDEPGSTCMSTDSFLGNSETAQSSISNSMLSGMGNGQVDTCCSHSSDLNRDEERNEQHKGAFSSQSEYSPQNTNELLSLITS